MLQVVFTYATTIIIDYKRAGDDIIVMAFS